MKSLRKRLLSSSRGATLIEYTLLCSLLGVIAIGAMKHVSYGIWQPLMTTTDTLCLAGGGTEGSEGGGAYQTPARRCINETPPSNGK